MKCVQFLKAKSAHPDQYLNINKVATISLNLNSNIRTVACDYNRVYLRVAPRSWAQFGIVVKQI